MQSVIQWHLVKDSDVVYASDDFLASLTTYWQESTVNYVVYKWYNMVRQQKQFFKYCEIYKQKLI